MAISIPIQVFVESPVYGGEPIDQTFYASKVELSWAWGQKPATARIIWVSADTSLQIVPLAQLRIVLGGHVFYGVTEQFEKSRGAEGGTDWMQHFEDSRRLLRHDVIRCRFNRKDWRNVGSGLRKRYSHILPINAYHALETYTDFPYTAAEILDFLFTAPDCKLPWTRVYHSALDTPIYDVDFMSGGAKLDAQVTQVSERVGTTFTLMGGRYRLVWCVKGEGSLPVAPEGLANNIRTGRRLSGNASRVEIVGDRNLYQVLDIPMEADWQAAWEEFYDPFFLAQDLCAEETTEVAIGSIPAGTHYTNISGDNDLVIGWQLAFARAQTITVGEYADLRDARSPGSGEVFRDYGKYQGRSRLSMPAVLYIKHLLFRAFRPPRNFTLVTAQGDLLPLASLELVSQSLVEVTHDPVTGIMGYETDVAVETNGYAIAQGYQLGVDAFRTLRPESFKLTEWQRYQDKWQHLEFQVDDSGQGYQFILFDEPVIRTEDLVDLPVINGVVQAYPVLRADAVFKTPAVRASLVFAGEPFSYVAGLPPIDEVVSEAGLHGQYVMRYGMPGIEEELAYADDWTATEKASVLAASLLLRQSVYDAGGYQSPVPSGQQLTSMIDRVTVVADATGGYDESIDWTAERRSAAFEAERDYERKQHLLARLPGEQAMRVEARQRTLFALALKSNPAFSKSITSAAGLLFGHAAPEVIYVTAGAGALSVGTPLWKPAAPSPNAVMPAQSNSTATPVFAGVTLLEAEEAAGPVRVAYTGDHPVRVRGPVSVMDSLGLSAGQNYLVSGGAPTVAQALEAVASGTTKLIMARFGGGGGSSLPTWI